MMWRTFWTDISTYHDVDDFLNRVEADGYEPRFMSLRNEAVPGNKMTVYVTARKKTV